VFRPLKSWEKGGKKYLATSGGQPGPDQIGGANRVLGLLVLPAAVAYAHHETQTCPDGEGDTDNRHPSGNDRHCEGGENLEAKAAMTTPIRTQTTVAATTMTSRTTTTAAAWAARVGKRSPNSRTKLNPMWAARS